MKARRVKKGEKYWKIDSGLMFLHMEDARTQFADIDYANGNYFNTKEEAETMARKLRAVLKGADVIEMPSEEDLYNEEFKTNHYFIAKDGAAVVGAHQTGFKHCYDWLKSKIVG